MTQYQPDEKNRIKRQKSDLAIRLAKEGRWTEAVQTNRELLGIFPDDSETLNRLGKAYLELKKFGEAKAAYEHAVQTDPGNTIAQKNLGRLSQYQAVPSAISPSDSTPETVAAASFSAAQTAREKIAPSIFIEETGKTGTTNLVHLAPALVLAKLTAGDAVTLEVDSKNQNLLVKSHDGELLGQVEPKMALRLIRLIASGNRYTAAVTSVGEQQLKIIIRETYQHPSQRGRLSFPPKTGGAGYRAYTRDSVLRYGVDEDDEAGDGDADDDDEAESSEEESEIAEDFTDENDQDDL